MIVTFGTILGLLITHNVKKIEAFQNIFLNLFTVSLYTLHLIMMFFTKVPSLTEGRSRPTCSSSWKADR